jgi:hypothetical protein
LLGGVLLALVLLGGIILATRDRSHVASRWDPAVLPVVRFVEHERGRTFRHPVAVDLLAPDRFAALVKSQSTLTAKELAGFDRSVAELRALGLLSGAVDPNTVAGQGRTEEVLGLYQPSTKHVSIQGSQLTPAVRVTLAHELTHALQDQEVDLAALQRRTDPVTRAVVEGDAVVVEEAYRRTLSPADADSFQKERAAGVAAAASAEGAAPPPTALANQSLFPYLFGPTFIRAVRQRGGNAAVDRALHHPPRSDADLLDPERWLAGTTPAAVATPRLRAGEAALDPPAPFGQVRLFEVLGSRLSYQQSLDSVAGWRGDRALRFRSRGATCVAVATVFVDAGHADRFVLAARQWAASVPGATVAATATTVELRSCDPGPAAPASPTVDPPPFKVLSLRASIVGLFLDRGVALAPALCAVDQVVSRVGPAQLVNYENGTGPTDLASGIADATRQAMAACGARSG